MQPLFSLIIVNYNSGVFLLELLASLDSLSSSEIIVIDNASSDNTRLLLTHASSCNTKFIWSDHNLGFGAACNIAASHARGDILIFINPDARLVDHTDFEGFFLRHLSSNNVGIVAPRIVYPDGLPQPSWSKRYSTLQTFLPQLLSLGTIYRSLSYNKHIKSIAAWFGIRLFGRAAKDYISRFKPVSASTYCSWVSGACFGISKILFNRLNGFDEAFFLYCEDEDICRRAVNVGFNILYSPDLTISHTVACGDSARSLLGKLHPAASFKIVSALYYLKKYNTGTWVIDKPLFIFFVLLRLVVGFSLLASPRHSMRLIYRLLLL